MTLLLPLLGAAAGSLVGSFIATLCIRWPRGEQALSGRSHCDSCGRNLAAYELVPILSWAANRGKCRTCGASIAALHPQIEVAGALLAGLALLLSPGWAGAALALLWLFLLPLAILDARHFWLPQSLTLATAVGGVVLGGLATGATLADRLIGGAAGVASLGAIAFVYRRARGREGLGAGDPKLLGAIGLWTGWQALAPMLVIASVGGLILALAMSRGRLDRLPFGTLLSAAAFLWTGLMAALFRPLF